MPAYLIDGTFELFRCFHGAPRQQDSEGCEIGAARGLLFTLAKLIDKRTPTHAAIAFDSVVSRVSGAERQTEMGLLRSQYPLAADVARALGIAIWPMSRFQADEALATGARLLAADPTIDRVVICSRDQDFCQCVEGERVVLLDRQRGITTDEAVVRDRYGVAPEQIPAYFALVGDPSDGIPGLPGFGPKAAAALIGAFGALEDFPQAPEAWTATGLRGAARLASTFADRRLEALLYRNLSIRRADVPLPHGTDDLRWGGVRPDLLEPLARRLDAAEAAARVGLELS